MKNNYGQSSMLLTIQDLVAISRDRIPKMFDGKSHISPVA